MCIRDSISILPVIEEEELIGTGATVTQAQVQTNTIGKVVTLQVVTKEQKTFTVTVQQDNTGASQIIDTRPVGEITTTVEVPVETNSSSVNVNPTSGVRTQFTVSVNITSSLTFVPESITQEQCVPVAVQNTDYATTQEQVIQSQCQNGTGIQTTVLINTTDSTIQPVVVDQHLIPIVDVGIVPVVPEVVVTEQQFSTVITQNVQLQHFIDYVQGANPILSGVTPTNTIIDTIGSHTIKITAVFKIQNKIERVVTLEDTDTGVVSIIEDVEIPEIKPVTVQTNVTETGLTVITSNSVEEIQIVNPQITTIIEQIKNQFPVFNPEQIESIQSTNFSVSSQVTIVAEVQVGVEQQFTVNANPQTGAINIIDSQILPPIMVKPVKQPTVVIPPSEYTTAEVLEVVTFVQTQEISVIGAGSTVQNISTKPLSNGQIYTVVLQNPQGQNFTSTLIKDPNTGVINVMDVREIKVQVQQQTTVQVQASVTITKVDEHTGVTTIQTNDPNEINTNEQTIQVITYINQNNDNVQNCQVQSTETRDYESNT